MDVVVAILNYNGRTFLEKFLPSVILHSKDLADVVVIDNASSDKSIEYLESFQPEVQIIQLEQNLGFAEGYNQGLKSLDYLYVLLLNSDILVPKGYLEPLIRVLNQNKDVACVQPKIKSFHQPNKFEHAGAAGGFLDFLGYPFCQGRLLNKTEEDHGQYNQDKPVFWTTGACMLIRKRVFDQAGAFDGRFFAHMEEIDLCWRIQKLGFTCYYTHESEVFHVGGGTLSYQSPQKVFLNFRNNLWMLLKNLPLRDLCWIIPLRLILDGLAGILFLMQKNPPAFMAVIRAHFSFYRLARTIFKQRSSSIKIALFPKSLVYQFYIRGRKRYQEW